MRKILIPGLSIASALGFAALTAVPAHAIVVTCDQDANALGNALLGGGGITITNATLAGQGTCNPDPQLFELNGSSGTFVNVEGTYGIGSGIVLSSGQATDYGTGPNTDVGLTTGYGVGANAGQEALLQPISGQSNHNDVTQLDLVFDVDGNTDFVFFNVVFGSEEFPEFVASSFVDAFGIFLNGINIAIFDGLPLNINHPDMALTPGTELDGILDPTAGLGDPIMLFTGAVTPGSTGNTLTFIVADSGDDALDTTVYLSGFGNVDPGGGTIGGGIDQPPPPETVSEPATLGFLGLSLAGLAWLRRRTRMA